MLSKTLGLGLVCLILLPLVSDAQRHGSRQEIRHWKKAQKRYLPLAIELSGGATQFWGELRQRNTNGVYGAGLSYTLQNSQAISFGLEVQQGQLSGREHSFFNSRFANRNSSIAILSRWDAIRGLTWNPENRASLQLYVGIGLMKFSAQARDLQTNEIVRFTNHSTNSGRTPLFRKYGTPTKTGGITQTNERAVPFGITPAYRLTKSLTIGLDLRANCVRTDKLDATSGYNLSNPEEAESYSNTPNDWFSTTTVVLNYRFTRPR
jgi:hypothetical protein